MPVAQSGVRLSRGLKRATMTLMIVVFIFLLRVSYTDIIVPRYGYLGYAYFSPPAALEAVLLALAIVPAALLPMELCRPSQYSLWFIYPIGLIPAILVPMYNAALTPVDLLALSVTLLLCFLLLLAANRLPLGRWPQLALPPSLFWFGTLGFVVLVLLAIQVIFGVPVSLPSLSQVYQRRAEFKQTVAESGAGVVYLSLWLANVINPLLMARGLLERRWVWGLIGLAGQLLVFSISGFKSVLLTPALLIGLTVLIAGDGTRFGRRFLMALVGVVGLGLVLDPLLPANLISGLLVRRLIVTPGMLTGVYVQFFSTHPPAMLGYAAFRGLAENVYGQGPALVIGEYLS